MNDNEAFHGVGAGDGEGLSMEQLYASYKPLMFSLAYRMLGSVTDAEDIVHEAFLAFARASGRDGEAIRNTKAYLCKIVTNRCIDRLRFTSDLGCRNR